jgi:Protein of unknown function (DUF1569)
MASDGIVGAVEMNRAAVADFVDAARNLGSSRWAEPRAPGKWSPAQIAEHLGIAYELAGQILSGAADMPGRKPPRFLHPVIRLLIRKTVLRSGKFPKLKTLPVFEPSSRPGSQGLVCSRLQGASDVFEQSASEKVRAGTLALNHPYYGRFGIEEFVRLQAYHARHHRAQLL